MHTVCHDTPPPKREQDKLVPAMTETAKDWVNRVGNDVLKDASQGFLERGLQPPGREATR